MRKRVANRRLDVGERVIAAVIRRIALLDGADDAHAHGVKPGIDNLPYALGIAGIRVDVDLPALRLSANQALGCRNRIRHKRWLALAALSEAHDGVGRSRKVVDADLRDLLGRRAERDAALRRRTALGGLQGDAAEAVRVADRRRRYARFPATVKEILRRAAVPLQGAARHLLDDAVARQILLDAAHEFLELSRVVVYGIPLRILIRIESRRIEIILIEHDSRITVESEPFSPFLSLKGRQKEPRIARRQDGCDGASRQRQHLARRRHSHRRAIGQEHQVRRLGQRNEVGRRKRQERIARAPQSRDARRIEDRPVFIGVKRTYLSLHASPSRTLSAGSACAAASPDSRAALSGATFFAAFFLRGL